VTDADLRQQDLELRRQLMRRAVERVWTVDLGESLPMAGFSLGPPPRAKGAAYAPRGTREGSIADLSRRYRSRAVSPVEVARRALEQAEATQTILNAWITMLPDSTLAEARASEERFRRGQPLGPLDGIPIGVKDLIHMEAVRTTSGSKIMADFVAKEDAPVIRRLRAAGAVFLGKTNLHEFAYGGTGDVSHFGPCRNPRNPEHMAGGSSSGSAAAVAAGVCPMALGTDTAGSIRMPAALCGIVGLKPTYGRVPTEGVIPLSWSQDHVGPLAATVEDAALSLSAMCDFDVPDLAPKAKLRIGLCRELFFEHLEAEVRSVVERTISRLGEVREIEIPHLHVAPAGQMIITSAEASAFHGHWLATRPEDYDWRIRNRLEASAEMSGRDYVQAMRLRGLLVQEMSAAMDDVDVLAMPTEACTAPKVGQREVQLEDGPADVTALLVRNTGPINYVGFPAVTIPCGGAANGLPVALQLVGRPWQEAQLLQAAATAEALLG